VIPYGALGSKAKSSDKQNDASDQKSLNEQTPRSFNNNIKFDVQANESGSRGQNIGCGWGGASGPGTSVDMKVHANKAAADSTQNIGNWN
jgi:hypothetical protein